MDFFFSKCKINVQIPTFHACSAVSIDLQHLFTFAGDRLQFIHITSEKGYILWEINKTLYFQKSIPSQRDRMSFFTLLFATHSLPSLNDSSFHRAEGGKNDTSLPFPFFLS